MINNPYKKMTKDLRKVWEKFSTCNESNSVLIDDTKYKSLLNPVSSNFVLFSLCGLVNDTLFIFSFSI